MAWLRTSAVLQREIIKGILHAGVVATDGLAMEQSGASLDLQQNLTISMVNSKCKNNIPSMLTKIVADRRRCITLWASKSHPNPEHTPVVRYPGSSGVGCDLLAHKVI